MTYYFRRLARLADRLLCGIFGHVDTFDPMPYQPFIGSHLTYRWSTVTRPRCASCGIRL